ncbi:hypothetical protein [Pengzhenrongella sicca]|uniref:Uncharacterized protein n=1 Tax=Pengzhenrongella sicca TaxID=2819238 RepID=A0A8A4ZFT6_9MICO|nr:hypothetical protein [Pengzhenrongella sicca]QTE30872.1 hypothetical protein J4E96_08070 [Pengzhenrongella sicca]
MGLPLQAQSKPARIADDNAVVYEGTDGKTDVVVHALETGDESIIVEVGSLGAQWAFDAAGELVETWYEVTADSIVQVVRHDASGVQYPVVADPVWSGGLGVYGHFNRAETATWASYGVSGIGLAGGACAALGGLGGPIVAAVAGGSCGVVAATLIHSAGIAQTSSPKKCFYVSIVAPGPTGVWAGTYKDSRCK